jgi:hypothetical protein
MTKFVPKGYLSIAEALNRLGRQLFPAEWTGEEYKAPEGLISEDEWLNWAPARGGDAPDHEAARKILAASAEEALHPTGDPCSPSYKADYIARKRYRNTRGRLRVLLEAGNLEAAILDPFTGILHRAQTSLWRRLDADRMLTKQQAPIPRSPNTGSILIKEFHSPKQPDKPLPAAKLQEIIGALRQKIATESLTREQQKDFVRKTFPTYRVTARQFAKIFQGVPVRTGRPKKPDTK